MFSKKNNYFFYTGFKIKNIVPSEDCFAVNSCTYSVCVYLFVFVCISVKNAVEMHHRNQAQQCERDFSRLGTN